MSTTANMTKVLIKALDVCFIHDIIGILSRNVFVCRIPEYVLLIQPYPAMLTNHMNDFKSLIYLKTISSVFGR